MKHILVGTDGSAAAANAMRWASRLASRHGADVIVMTGFEPSDSELPPGRADTLLARRQDELEAWSAAAKLGNVSVRTVLEPGDPRPGILAVADREEAGLIVVGRVGRSAGPGLLHIGSMAEWLAHHVDRPIAVVGGGVSLTTRNVLVGVDGSDGSRVAVRWVRDLATDSEMRAVAVSVDQPVLEWTPADHPDNWRRGLERRICDDYAVDLTAPHLEVEAVAMWGMNVADALLQVAQEQRSDLVVVGTRGLGGFAGLRVGGVALKVLHRSDRAVVLVPPG
ncbi:MAG: universal stress protein [Acidimicrobiales bacterium]